MRALIQPLVCCFSILLISVLISSSYAQNNATSKNSNMYDFIEAADEFTSRMIYMTHNRKFTVPNGTLLTIAPSITIPVFRPNQKPFHGGLNSDIKASWYFYMDFDKMGMTSSSHYWPLDFTRPPFYPFGELMRINPKRPVQKRPSYHHNYHYRPHYRTPLIKYYRRMDTNYNDNRNLKEESVGTKIEQQLRSKQVHLGSIYTKPNSQHEEEKSRPRRSVLSLPPPDSIHGGERAHMIPAMENLMNNLGFEGRDCMLRAMCEIHEYPLQGGYGLFGEIFTLMFTVSASPYAESHMPEYLKAEMAGRKRECEAYKKKCSKSIFKWEEKSSSYMDERDNMV